MPLSFKQFPFIRLVCFLIAGIVTQWYFQLSLNASLTITAVVVLLFGFYKLLFAKKFTLAWLHGVLILLLFFCVGLMITWQQNMRNNLKWYKNIYSEGDIVLITIKEPLVDKPNSYKALAQVNAVYKNNYWFFTEGNILIYFKKDSVKPALQYGSQLVFSKSINSIKNNGNPAALDYSRYSLFQNITGQTFIKTNDYTILQSYNINYLQKFLFFIRDWALQTIRKNIHSQKELGIAEALLIGYRNDLDKDLVQAYSNTGVVHIIAISGLHIAVIYGALIWLFARFKSKRIKKWAQPVVILCVIWLFTLIAGAAPSVLRAAVMFTFVVVGKFFGKNGNIYNTLAASAFVLLLANPFYLWDVGFQLSYAAVFSIVLFAKPISNLLYFKNKSLRWIWELGAVSLAAQVFTTPVIIYQFHQLPLLFFFSNLLIVPLSGIVLFGELLLFCFAWWKMAASFIGMLIEMLIRWMNNFIEHIDKLPFSVWDGLNISVVQLILLFIITALISFWIFNKHTKYLIAALSFIIVFVVLRDVDLISHKKQQELIIYNVPKQTAIDFISGNTCCFAGDSVVLQNAALRNFNLKPARVYSRVYSLSNTLLPDVKNCILQINSSKVLILDKIYFNQNITGKVKLDVLILSRNFNETPEQINDLFDCRYIIADSSIPQWKLAKWKKEFEELHLPFYSVDQYGAAVIKL